MRNRRRRVNAGATNGFGSNLLNLSVFVMLLAFFIVINAISNFEQTKVKPVMESLGYTFASRVATSQADERPSVTEDDDTSINEGDTLDRMRALFNAQIPGYEAVVSHRKGMMYVKLPFDDFEAAVMAVGQRNALNEKDADSAKLLEGFFLPTLVALMKSQNAGRPYRMDMMLNIADNPATLQNQQPKQLAALMARMGAIAQTIEAAGLSTRLISAGLQKGEAGTIELVFRRHVPFNPLGTENDEQ